MRAPFTTVISYDTATAQVTAFSFSLTPPSTVDYTVTGLNGTPLDIAGSSILVDGSGTVIDSFEINIALNSGPTISRLDTVSGVTRFATVSSILLRGSALGNPLADNTLDERLFTVFGGLPTSRIELRTETADRGEPTELLVSGYARFDTQSVTTAPVPLPAGMALMLSGLAGLTMIRRRKARAV